jgi:hypothetical protein
MNSGTYKQLVLFTLLLLGYPLMAQRFYASAAGGVNLAQIDGDNSAGFNKAKYSFGARIDYPIKPSTDLCIELLYSGRGSRGKVNQLLIDLNYIELPFLISLRDWYIEKEKYDKVRLDAGLSYGYLFNIKTGNTPISKLAENAKSSDVSFVGGVAYMFTKKIGVSVRYTRSFSQFVKDESLDTGGFLSYFTTIRGEYHF